MSISDAQKDILRAVRKAAATGHGKPSFLCELPDKTLWRVFKRMRAGESAPKIAEFLHGRGVAPGDSTNSTAKLVLRFRKRISHLLISSSVSPAPYPEKPVSGRPPVDTLVRNQDLPGIEALIERYNRVIDGMLREAGEDPGSVSPHLPKHVQALTALEKVAIRVREDLRKNPPDTKERETRVTEKFRRIVNILPDGGQRMLEAGERFIASLDKYAIEVKELPDGTMVPVNEKNT